MEKTDGIECLSTVTNIPYKLLKKLAEKMVYIIGDNISNYINTIDVGIGTLEVVIGDCMDYVFTPSEELSKVIDNVLETNQSPLEVKAEEALVKKFIDTYKDLF